jgi:hypothetical protein
MRVGAAGRAVSGERASGGRRHRAWPAARGRDPDGVERGLGTKVNGKRDFGHLRRGEMAVLAGPPCLLSKMSKKNPTIARVLAML